MTRWALHWFRRDLRVVGNPALQHAHRSAGGAVVGFFCFDRVFLAREDFSANRFQFFLNTLAALREELRSLGGDLLCLDVGPEAAFGQLFATLADRKVPAPSLVTFNRDYEPFATARDRKMLDWLEDRGVATHTERDHCVLEPSEVGKEDDNGAYQVYTPFQRRWLKLFATADVQHRIRVQHDALRRSGARAAGEKVFALDWRALVGDNLPDTLDRYRRQNAERTTIAIPPAGSHVAREGLETFRPKLVRYGSQRDFPGENGTSHFSIYFKNGSLTVAQVIAALRLEAFAKGTKTGAAVFFGELIWREFYYHILGRFPSVETQAFQPRYANLPWENREDYFRAWCEGRTGYPIVDAGMRQLRQTGWMHNRVRMIVASFLTKDLLIDYRWGERWFMQQLLDGDLAPNNGGWQWSASTGCDAQPYFRIFNPVLQSKRFDPDGSYIRTYVPELGEVASKHIHFPDSAERPREYPPPIVDHAERKAKALAMFEKPTTI